MQLSLGSSEVLGAVLDFRAVAVFDPFRLTSLSQTRCIALSYLLRFDATFDV